MYRLYHSCLLLLMFLLPACKNETQSPALAAPSQSSLILESETLDRKTGDCTGNEDFEKKCAEISLSYPVVKTGPELLKKSVMQWSNDFLIGLLDPTLDPDQEVSLEAAITSFVDIHREMTEEMPELPGHYVVEVEDTVLLQNEKYLTLRLDAYSYTGGAHPNASAAVNTFRIDSGEILYAGDMVKDLAALHKMAEQQFREVQKEAFVDGFDFTESWPFKLADNIGLTTKGLYFCYVPYEVAPYALGFTEFVIPFEKLEGNWKLDTGI